ncbi:MAG: Fe-S cluster assembly scaffold protein NifU [Bacillota bacterium]|nr:Fe-S cluster assembly scaffold protein NifU [Bacillota bacterium]
MLYTDIVMEHFANPRNVGEIKDADGVGEVGNLQCGDIMRIYINVENDIITECKFKTFGCGSAIASSSITTELVKGKTIDEALELTNKDVVQQLGGLPSVKVHCSVLAEDALKVAIYNYSRKHNKIYKALEGFEPSQLNHEH